jgi:hypothetical protein
MKANICIRNATASDIRRLKEVIEASVRGLQAKDYSPAQIEGALQSVYGVDSPLIADGTYFVAEISESRDQPEIVACGGWSKRKTLYGGDQYAAREDLPLDPTRDAAKIRAFFVHPQWARGGIGGLPGRRPDSLLRPKYPNGELAFPEFWLLLSPEGLYTSARFEAKIAWFAPSDRGRFPQPRFFYSCGPQVCDGCHTIRRIFLLLHSAF